MKDIEDDIGRLARDVTAAAKKAAGEAAEAAALLVEQGRDSAQQAFDKINAARERAVTRLKD